MPAGIMMTLWTCRVPKAAWNLFGAGRHKLQCHAAPPTHTLLFTSSMSDNPLRSLSTFGFSDREISKIVRLAPRVESLPQARIEGLLEYLLSKVTTVEKVKSLILLHPEALLASLEIRVKPAVQFLKDLGLNDDQIASILVRFPNVLGYGVKSDLTPQMHYLLSLGVTKEELPHLVLERPRVLGIYIEPVVRYLKRLGVKRTDIGKMLETFPIDYSIPIGFFRADMV